MIAHMLNIAVGLHFFPGGFIDLFIFGILQGNAKTNWLLIIPVGIVYFILYYVIFTVLIKKLNLKTPGREDDGETKLFTKADYQAKQNSAVHGSGDGAGDASTDERSELITKGLGGKANISDVDCCATRLRCTVIKPELVNEALLKQTRPSGIIKKGKGIQVIYGPSVSVIKSNLEDYLATAPDELYVENSGPAVSSDTMEENRKNQEAVSSVQTDVRKSFASPFKGEAHPLQIHRMRLLQER